MRAVSMIAMLVASQAALSVAHAQNYPNKTIRLVVPVPPGGGTDTLAREIAQKLTERLGQPVLVDNRPGASSIIGSEMVAKAAPDGHTLLMAFTPHVTNLSLRAKMPYDTVNDFAPVSMVAVTPGVLVVHPSLPVKSVGELIALAKAKPNRLNYASGGSGSTTHLSAALFGAMAGVSMVHVPYKGAAPALNDLVGGHVSLMFGNIISTLPHVRSGRLRALAVTGAGRTPAAPELPTIAETAGLRGYEALAWFALLAPAHTPAAVIAKLNSEVVAILQLPEVKERLATQGADATPSTPDQLGRYIRSEIEKWGKVIRDSGARAE